MTGQRRRRLGVRSWREVLGRLEGAGTNVQVLAMQPTLLVGPAGSGMSRLAMRIAEELGVPRLDVGLGGNADTKVLGGTSRGWGSGKPTDLATLLAMRETASAIVLLDELDKSHSGVSSGKRHSGIPSGDARAGNRTPSCRRVLENGVRLLGCDVGRHGQ
jgi:hypothetical protein